MKQTNANTNKISLITRHTPLARRGVVARLFDEPSERELSDDRDDREDDDRRRDRVSAHAAPQRSPGVRDPREPGRDGPAEEDADENPYDRHPIGNQPDKKRNEPDGQAAGTAAPQLAPPDTTTNVVAELTTLAPM